jgi:DNA-binding NarL/FixJ family response regulator
VLAAQPDVLLVDSAALERADAMRRAEPALSSTLIVACGVGDAPEEVIACAQQGASGYVARDASAKDLIATVRSIERGELPCSPRVAAMLFRQLASRTRAEPAEGDNGLTIREREVVRLIDRGMSNKEIAATLGIEVTTVKNHVHHVLEKLQVRRRSAAAARMRPSLAPPPQGRHESLDSVV